MKNKLQLEKISLSAAFTYGVLKLPQKKIDPYTRTLIGLAAGFGMFMNVDNTIKSIGIGTMFAGFLQSFDALKGGRLTFNNGNKIIYILDENNGISMVAPGEIPDNNIDGFTFKGLNGVFKLYNGVYAGIDSKSKIKYSFGLSKFANKPGGSGLMSKAWTDKQTDLRWAALYQKSIG